MKYEYKNPNYHRVEGLSIEELTLILKEVHDTHVDWKDEPFESMVGIFASDDFYHHHYTAKEYIKLQTTNHDSETTKNY